MKIGITNDHHGLYLKEILVKYLKECGYEVINYGSNTIEPIDFTDPAIEMGKNISNNNIDYGIAICGTGIGMSIVLNKIKGVYCAKVSSLSDATLCKAHNDANCIAISEDLEEAKAKEIVKKFLDTPFSNVEKYVKRNNKIKDLENA